MKTISRKTLYTTTWLILLFQVVMLAKYLPFIYFVILLMCWIFSFYYIMKYFFEKEE